MWRSEPQIPVASTRTTASSSATGVGSGRSSTRTSPGAWKVTARTAASIESAPRPRLRARAARFARRVRRPGKAGGVRQAHRRRMHCPMRHLNSGSVCDAFHYLAHGAIPAVRRGRYREDMSRLRCWGRRRIVGAAAGCIGLALAGLGIAACGGSSTSATTGGTLNILTPSFTDHEDPQPGYEATGWEARYNVYITMRTYAHATGVAGTQVIPGLAKALPTVSKDGLTHTMFMRQGP